MKLIALSGKKGLGLFAMVDDDKFEWLLQSKWYATKKGNTVYAIGWIKDESGKRIRMPMHRAIVGVTDRMIEVDHADMDGLNNVSGNLRTCTKQQNSLNRPGLNGATSRFKGVSWDKIRNKWVVTAMFNDVSRYLGSFEKEDEAARIYNQFAKEHHGEFARFNDVSPLFPEFGWSPVVLTLSNKSGFRGVCFNKELKKWKAHIYFNGKQKYLGSFTDPSVAASIYDAKAKELLGDAARLNFP